MEEIIFPNQIRTYRKQFGCTMQELADELGMSLSAISKIEKGYRRLDQSQLMHVANFLNCRLQDLFVNELNSQPEVVQAWRKEQERRSKINVTGGLKTMGAGFRQIRNEKNLTLIEVSENAGMTLSVYHRIEMGQREVSDKEFKAIAKALLTTPEKLRENIKNLESRGILNEIIQKNDAKYRLLATPKGSVAADISKLAVYGTRAEDGAILFDFANPIDKINRPSLLQGKVSAYAIRLGKNRLSSVLPESALLYIDPTMTAKDGDLAVYYTDSNKAVLVKLLAKNKKLYGRRVNPDEQIEITEDAKLHKIVLISL